MAYIGAVKQATHANFTPEQIVAHFQAMYTPDDWRYKDLDLSKWKVGVLRRELYARKQGARIPAGTTILWQPRDAEPDGALKNIGARCYLHPMLMCHTVHRADLIKE